MKKEVKVVMIPSEKASIGQIYLKPKMNVYNEIAVENHNNGIYDTKPQHLYFLSDAEIKEGDWYLINQYGKGLLLATQPATTEELQHQHKFECKKVIASTDQSLGLPIPSNEFLKKYCDNNGVGRVEVEHKYGTIAESYFDSEVERVTVKMKINTDNTINASFIDDRMYSRSEVIGILKDIFLHSYNEYLFEHHAGDFRNLDEWIKNNLK